MVKLVTHKFVSAIPDGDDTGLVRPSNWNDTHDVSGVAESGANSDITSLTGITGGIDTPDYLQLDTAAAASIALGKLRWNTATATASFGIIDGTTEVNIGEQMYAYVTNAEAVTITAGQAVYLYAATGNRASVKLASNLGDSTSAKTLGLVTADIAAGATGFVTTQGVLAKLDTSAFAEGVTLYLGATAGSLTATKPYAPNHLVYIGVVERANAGNGQIYVRPQNGYELDEIHDVQIISPANGQTILYDASTSLWKNANLTAGTGVSITNGAASATITNTAPDQTVVLNNGTGISVTGTYPNFTVTNTSPSSGGTVTSVTATSPVTSTGGTTPVIAMPAATGSVNGYLTSTDWTTFNGKGNGTVTSVAALTLGTTGTDLSSTVATGTTTPVITLQVPTASASNRGALSSTDWSTFNGKQSTLVSGTNIKTINGTSVLGSGNLTVSASAGGSNTQVQYNSTGALAGSSNFTFDGTALALASAPTNTVPAFNLTGTPNNAAGAKTGVLAVGSNFTASDKNIMASFVQDINDYTQIVVQNPNAGAAASSDFIVNNNNTTGAGVYGDFGINSSGWTGTAGTVSLNAPNMIYLTATGGDLTIGTTTSNAIRFVTNGGADKLIFDANGNVGIGVTPAGTDLVELGAGTATKAPLGFTAGTVLTTANSGSMEYDGNTPYFSIAESTRGVLPTEQIVVLTGTNTLTSQTGAQPIFDGGGGPTNGSVTLPIGTYQYECVFALTGMSATSGSYGFNLGGAATKTWNYQASTSKTSTALATGMATLQAWGTSATTALMPATTGTVGTALIKGIIRVTVAGTVIPQVSLTVASAAVIQAGSYFKVSPLGNVSTVATVGNWA